MKYIIIAVIFAVSSMLAVEINNKVPGFEGESFDGKKIDINDYKGKVVLLDFWASWCAPCRKEMPFLLELHREFSEKGLVIIGINIDKKLKKAKKFLNNLKEMPEFEIIHDKNSKIPPKFEIEAMPTTILIDRNMNVRYIHEGFTESEKEKYVKEIKELLNEKSN